MSQKLRPEREWPGVSSRWTPWAFLLIGGFSSAPAGAQIVFLPTWHQFSVQTTVSVPDQGSAALGRTAGRRTGRNWRGVPGLPNVRTNRGVRQRAPAGRVHVTVIDLAAWDAAILGSRSGNLATGPNLRRAARSQQQAVTRSASDRAGNLSLAEIRRLRRAQSSHR